MASIRKIDGGYLVRWESGRDFEGRRLQGSRVVATRKAAERLAAEMHLKREGRALAPERGLIVRAYLERWIERREGLENARRKTLDGYRRMISRLNCYLGAVKLDQLDAYTIENALGRMAKGGGRWGRPMAANTIRNYFRVLDRALSDAVRWKLIVANPCDAVERPKGARTVAKAPTAEQTRLLLEAAQGTRYFTFIYLALASGLRLGELLGLRWEDLDLKRGSLTVFQTVQEVGSEIFFERPKTEQSARRISIGEDVIVALRQHKATQAKERLKAGEVWEDHDLVFPDYGGIPRRPCYQSRAVRKLADSVGMPKEVSPVHGLRHGHATLVYAAQKDIKAVQERLGHASPLITMALYVHSDEERDKEAAQIASSFMEALRVKQ